MASLTYKTYSAKKEAGKVLAAILIPIATLAVSLFTIFNFANFGTKLLCPFIAVMWLAGVIIAILVPQQREELLHRTQKIILAYCAVMLLLKVGIGVASGVSSEMLAASFDQAVTLTGGNTLPGILQNILNIYVYIIPLAHFSLLVKTFLNFRKNISIEKAFGRARSFRKPHTDKQHTKSI